MTIISIKDVGKGLNSDLSAEELGPGYWSDVTNVRFANGYAERFDGMSAVFTAPSVTPYFLIPYQLSTVGYWVHAGLSAVYVDDGTTRTDITGTAPTGGIDDKWTGGVIGGVLVLNNGVDKPMFWNGDTGTNLATLTGWGATWKAASVRPFKNYLVALGITKGASVYPHMVKWSHTAVAGTIPTSWDETNPALDAGEQDLAETPDLLVDCLALGDVNIVYKERSMYAMSYVGAPYIFRFQRLPGDVGMLARGCAVATPLGHVVLSSGDIVLQAGQGAVSIANGFVKDYVFNNLNSSAYKRAFVTSNPPKNEVWVCFPYGTSTTCNRAAVWNWIDKTWAIRVLTNVTYGAFGQFAPSSSLGTWAGDVGTWDTDSTTWNTDEYSKAQSKLLLCQTTPSIVMVDSGNTDNGSLMTATLERKAMHFDSPNVVKLLRAVFPRVDSTPPATLSIQVGSSMYADEEPTWQTAQNFIVGSQTKVDFFATGRYFSLRINNADYPGWRLRTLDIDYVEQGAF